MTETTPNASARGRRAHISLTVAFGLAMSANFMLTLLMGRMLDSASFGVLGLLVAIFLFCSMPANALAVVVVKRAAGWSTAGDNERIAAFHARFSARTAIGGGVLVAASIALSPLLMKVFRLRSPMPLILIAAALAFWLLLTVNRGVLQGMRLFNQLSASFVLEAVTRVVFAVALVWFWRSAVAAAIGIVLSSAISWLATLRPIRRQLGPRPEPPPETDNPKLREAGAIVIALGAIAWLQNADVFAAKASMTAWDAGQYVATSTLGKAFFFFSLAAVTAMLPDASEARWQRGRLRVMGRALALVCAMAVPALALAFAAPNWIVSTVYGADRAQMASWLGPIVAASVFLALTYLGANYLAAIGRAWYVPIVIGAAIIEIGVLVAVGQSVAGIVLTVIATNAVAAIALGADAAIESRAEYEGEQFIEPDEREVASHAE